MTSYTLFGRTRTLDQWVRDPLCAVSADELAERLSTGWEFARALMRPSDRAVVEDQITVRAEVSVKLSGVTRSRDKYQAQIKVDGKVKFLGRFDTERDAALAYDKAIDDMKLCRAKNYA